MTGHKVTRGERTKTHGVRLETEANESGSTRKKTIGSRRAGRGTSRVSAYTDVEGSHYPFQLGGEQVMLQESADIREFFQACAAGDLAARRQFQEEFAEDIYNFPVKIYGATVDVAGDFYVYAFERDRIFSRLKTFEGRNSIQFRTFLSYYVLKHLFLEWRRTQKEVETISLQTPLGSSDDEQRTLEDVLPQTSQEEEFITETSASAAAVDTWNSLTVEERLDLKLLSLLECDLTPEELRLLATTAKRTIGETLALVAEVVDGLKRKDEKIARLRDDLDSVWGWILVRQKELQEINKKIHRLTSAEKPGSHDSLTAEKEALEQALAKRYRQRERITRDMQSYKLTTPYKDIARRLNMSIGTVCSRIFRLRERLLQELGDQGIERSHHD